MRRRKRARTTLLVVVSILLTASADGQEAVVGILSSSHAVNHLDSTLAFYRDVFGLNADPQPLRNPGIAALTGEAGAQLRRAVFRLPNTSFGFELTEFSGVHRNAGRAANIPDPGAAHLILRVRDLDRVVDAARKSGVQIVTPSSTPIKLRSTARGSRAILMRDPDGYLVEGEDVSSSSDSTSHENVQSAGMRYAMADREATLTFYGGLLGFKLTGNPEFRVNEAMADFTGVPEGSQLRALSGTFPGTNDSIAFYEFKDLPRTPFHLPVQDPGAPAMSLRVKDLDGLLRRLRAAGVPVLSARGEVVQFTATIRNILVEDPNGIHIELYEEKR
jgi:catechol 2,3-dioxygenase-like lactoylglutathione lyase family enzyme